MDLLEQIPAVIRLLAVFVIILGAIRIKLTLGNAFSLGAVILGVIFGLNPLAIVRSAFFSLADPKTLSLSAVVLLILVLSRSMESAGQMRRLLERFQGLIGHTGTNLILFPALIGLLPMPGGAIFSAPMVKSLGEKHHLSGAQLSYVNYWFRHIWEYWWPLYPGVLLGTTLAGIDLWAFVVCLFPMTVVSVSAGYGSLRKALKTAGRERTGERRADIAPFLRELTPILLVIVPGLLLGTWLTPVFAAAGLTFAKETGLIIALVAAIGWIWHSNRLSGAQRWASLRHRELLEMFYMITAIMIFKGMLTDSRAVTAISRELMQWHVAMVPITVILPFLVGSVTGITIAYVGTTFPILISLIHSAGQAHLILPYMMLAMTSGYMGVLFSPLHLCLLLSNAYFHTTLMPVYRYLLFPCTALQAGAVVYFFVFRSLL